MKLEIKNVSMVYGDVKALDDLTVTFEDGIYGILGPNGAGKSTMVNLIVDNIRRQTGEVLWDGTDILELGAGFRKLIGYMPQQQNMYDNYSPIGFLKYMSAVKGIPSKIAKEEIERLLRIVNLWEVRNKRIGGFSGGMKQRVMLAQALLGNPKLLILDEPTAGLDPNERIRIRNYIAELSRDKIILFATHVVSDIECIADKIILLKKGRLVACGEILEIMNSVEGKVGMLKCRDDISKLQKKYVAGNVNRTREGLTMRIVGDALPEEAEKISDVNLEDVYLYYLNNERVLD